MTKVPPLDLNEAFLLDAFVYHLTVDATTQSATVTLEIDPSFHSGFGAVSGLPTEGEAMIDLVFYGVEAVRVSGMLARRSEWAADEKPHDYEVSDLKVRRQSFRGRYKLVMHCQLGQTIKLAFSEVDVRLSDHRPGLVHDYEAME